MIPITQKQLEISKKLVYETDVEVCGPIYCDGTECRFSLVYFGEKIDGRQRCVQEVNDLMNYHTHPIGQKSYPSSEDIIVLLAFKKKTANPVIEIIFTAWGVWQLTAIRKKEMSKETRVSLAKEMDAKVLQHFYNASERGRAVNIDINLIKTFISKIKSFVDTYDIDLDIEFKPWW